MKLIVFDLDNTLCKSGFGMTTETEELLQAIISNGYRIAIASGKPVYYLTGFARAAHLYDCIFMGENGTVITFGVKLPPKERYVYPYDDKLNKVLTGIKDRIIEEIPNIYFQPNEIMITPFPKSKEEYDLVEKVLSEFDLDGITIYRHPTCYDILPSVINKGVSLDYLCNILCINYDEVITVGDAVNDIPLFKHSKLRIGIEHKVDEYVDYSFDTIEGALEFIIAQHL